MERFEKRVLIAMAVLTLSGGLLCLFILPETIAVHWNDQGQADNFLDKYVAVAISFVAAFIGILFWLNRNRIFVAQTSTGVLKWIWQVFTLLLGCIGILLQLIFACMNL